MTDMEYSRNERSISSWISMGSIAAGVGSGTSVPVPPSPPLPRLGMVCWSSFSGAVAALGAASDVEEAHVLGVRLDEVATHLDVVAHEHRAHLVGQGGLLHTDLEQRPA